MSKADVAKKAAALESQLKGKLFLEGGKPTAADVKAFNELLGAGNLNLFRWVKNMASFSDKERDSWGAPLKAPAPTATAAKPAAAAPAKKEEPKKAEPAKKPEPAPKAPAADEDEDLFGEETEEEKAAAAARKAKADEANKNRKVVIAKSSILLDVKVWDDTVDLEALATKIKSNVKDGLLWGAHKLVPVAFGMKKLQLLFVIEDEKVSSDDIEDIIMQYEEEVQSMDVVAWNKI